MQTATQQTALCDVPRMLQATARKAVACSRTGDVAGFAEARNVIKAQLDLHRIGNGQLTDDQHTALVRCYLDSARVTAELELGGGFRTTAVVEAFTHIDPELESWDYYRERLDDGPQLQSKAKVRRWKRITAAVVQRKAQWGLAARVAAETLDILGPWGWSVSWGHRPWEKASGSAPSRKEAMQAADAMLRKHGVRFEEVL